MLNAIFWVFFGLVVAPVTGVAIISFGLSF